MLILRYSEAILGPRGIFMLQMSTLKFGEPRWSPVKTFDFAPNYLEQKTNLSNFMQNKQIVGHNIQILQSISILL